MSTLLGVGSVALLLCYCVAAIVGHEYLTAALALGAVIYAGRA